MRAPSRPWFPIVAMLAACNHGGSSGLSQLRVASQLPPPASIVSPSSTVSVTFDRDPDPTTLTAEAFTVQDAAGSLAGSLAYDDASRTWTWTSADDLPRGAIVTATLAGSVRSTAGIALRDARTWRFAVREGAPGPLQLVRGNATVAMKLHASRFGRDRTLIGHDMSSYELGPSGAGPVEGTSIPISQWHVDASGGASAFGWWLGPGFTIFDFARRAPGGGWTSLGSSLNLPSQATSGLFLHGNERGDVLLHLASSGGHAMHFATRAAPTQWYHSAPQILQASERMFAALDGAGRFATLRNDGNFVIAERHDPALGTVGTYTVAQEPFAQAETLVASADGTLRAVWHAPGRAQQAVALPGQGFALPSDVPVAIPSGCAWRSSPRGDVVGWKDTWMVRSAAGSPEWTQITLSQNPLAVAMSPRGEIVWVDFQLPDQWLLHRWRAGEAPREPLLLAQVESWGARGAAVAIDGAGRVTVAFVPSVPGDLVAIVVE